MELETITGITSMVPCQCAQRKQSWKAVQSTWSQHDNLQYFKLHKKSSAISENWMSSCLRSVALEYLSCDLSLTLDYYLLDSSGQHPALLKEKKPTKQKKPTQNWKTTMFQLNKLYSNFYSYRWEDKLLWVQLIFQTKNINKISIYHILPSVHNTLASNRSLPIGLHQATLRGYEAKPLISALLPSLSLKGHQPKIYYMASSQPLMKA